MPSWSRENGFSISNSHHYTVGLQDGVEYVYQHTKPKEEFHDRLSLCKLGHF